MMDGNFIPSAPTAAMDGWSTASSTERIVEFYENAGCDYEHWSAGLNMHLGFYRTGLNPFDRESMLEQMNLEVALRLAGETESRRVFLDLGCGMGSIARSVVAHFPNSIVKGFTLVPSQVTIAAELNRQAKLDDRITVQCADYAALPVNGGSADGAWAVESACYANGAEKHDLIREAARVLRSSGRFVVADCFIKCDERRLNWLIRRCYRTVCSSWSLEEMPAIEEFVGALQANGFRDIAVEDISWRVAPSLAHAPYAVLTFLMTRLFAGERLNRHSINNLKASLLALLLGLNRSKFSYYLISSVRGEC